MLPRDNGGVVDARFRVYGTRNIRVIDLSVLSMHTAVHPQATVYAIAEMGTFQRGYHFTQWLIVGCTASDTIKHDHQ